MKFESKKTLWNRIRTRTSLLLQLLRCTDSQVCRCAAVFDDDSVCNLANGQDASSTCTNNDVCATVQEDCRTDETDDSNSVLSVASVDYVAEAGREISGRIRHSLQGARKKTEDAVMAVCDQVTKLVQIARQGNEEAQSTLHTIVGTGTSGGVHSNGMSIAEVVHTQAESVNSFVADTRKFFDQQFMTVDAASKSCQEMQFCVTQVVKLVFSSEILAYNIQIESARLGDDGRAFSVLGDEMVRFSSKVRDANIAIQSSLKLVTETMRQSQEESRAMDKRLDTFSDQLRLKMDDVQLRTSELTESLQLTLDRIAHRNEEVIACSQNALSELQFQDPLAQSLMRTEMDLDRLSSLIENGTCDWLEYSQYNPSVGNDGTADLTPGVVDLF